MLLSEFIQTEGRMCNHNIICDTCPVSPLKDEKGMSCGEFKLQYPQEYVNAVQKWAKEHPLVTNKKKLIEVFGNIESSEMGKETWLNAEYKDPAGKAEIGASLTTKDEIAKDVIAYFDERWDDSYGCKSQKTKEWWQDTEFDIQKDDTYYSVYTNGVASSYICNREYDSEVIAFGNACTDKNYMKKRATDIKLDNYVANFAKAMNGDWLADWTCDTQGKYYIYFDHNSHQWIVEGTLREQLPGVVYFKTRAIAQRCINEIIEPFEKGLI